MDVSHPAFRQVKAVSFRFYTSDEIRAQSVKALTNAELFDALNHPTVGGLYDAALGPFDKFSKCATCHLSAFACPGHFGHIDLAVPVYNPMLFPDLYRLLRVMCRFCQHFRVPPVPTALLAAKLKLLSRGMFLELGELDEYVRRGSFAGETGDAMEAEEDGKDGAVVLLERIDRFMAHALKRAPKAAAKVTVLEELRKRLIDEFMRKAVAGRCPNCKCFSPRFRKDGFSKIFEAPLGAREARDIKTQAAAQRCDLLGMGKPKKDVDMMEDVDLMKDVDADVDVEEDVEQEGNVSESETEDVAPGNSEKLRFLTPQHVQELLRRFWSKERAVLSLMFGAGHPGALVRYGGDYRMFFLECIPVAPTRFRPPSVMDGKTFDHPQNTYLTGILNLNRSILDLRTVGSSNGNVNADSNGLGEIVKAWVQLQDQVNSLFDSSRAPSGRGAAAPAGIKQLLEKKEGLFRKHMMGKRVNYAARSVISPDPNLETSEIGLPLVFARKLTYPEPVTRVNVTALRQAVVNGTEAYPGAHYVQTEDGALTSLAVMKREQRVAVANTLLANFDGKRGNVGKKVYRNVRNGDVVLVNRQPTLHKPSIMAHIVRVLPGEKTIRMHYANCNTYNADFDGVVRVRT